MQSWSKPIRHDLTFHTHLYENTHNENHLNASSILHNADW